ncbi:transposase [Streptomyces sp. NPDC056987]
MEAIVYRYRTGIPWRDLPARFGSWKTACSASCSPARRTMG